MAATRKKKQDDTAAYRQFRKELADGALRPLYVFHGEEAYLRAHYLEQMRAKLIPEGLESFNEHRFAGKDLTVRALAEAVDALPMMSERTLLVVQDYDLFKAPEAERTLMTELLSDLPDYCCLVFVYDTIEYKSDARMKKLTAAIAAHGLVVPFRRQEQGDLIDWIRRRFRALGHSIDTADAEYLIFLCGDLMTGLASEIGKIGTYAQAERVTRQDIDAVAIPITDAVVFQMTEALTQQRYDRAFAVYGDLLRLRQEPIMILAVLGKHLRQLYTARLALELRRDSRWLMELWGMRSDYPARLLMEAARKTTSEWCGRSLLMCQQLDRRMKSEKGIDNEGELKLLLMRLAQGK